MERLNQVQRGFAVAGEYPLDTIHAASRAAEAVGYNSIWLSQPPDRDSLATLAQVAELTDHIPLGIGAIPLTARSSAEIAEQVRKLRMPQQRLLLGVGSGIGPGALMRLRAGVEDLRSDLDVEIVVAPLGPRMCHLAGQIADSVLLNWLTPAFARRSGEWIQSGADTSRRAVPTVRAYVRCALGSATLPRLRAECDRYEALPHYAAHFRRQEVAPAQTTIAASSSDELQSRLHDYQNVIDEVIVRAITANDRIDETLELIDACKPMNHLSSSPDGVAS